MSLPRYPKYKESGVNWLGQIPSDWEVLQSRRLFSQRKGAALQDDEQLSASQKYGVVPQSLFMELEDQKVMLALAGLENFRHVEPDDFVISLRSFQGGIERSKYRGCVSPAYTVLSATREFAPDFWAYLLKSESYISALQTTTDGIRDGKNISYSQFGGLCIPFPSLSEQVSISAFLDRETAKIDALIAEQERLLTLLAEKRQATISHAVTKGLNPDVPMKDSGVEWLGEVPAHWAVHRTRRHLRKKLANGIFKKKEEFGQGTLLINVFDIYRDNFLVDYLSLDRVNCSNDEQDSFEVIAGDIFFVRSSLKQEGIAAVAMASEHLESVVFECHLIQGRFNPNSCLGRFASYLFNAVQYRAHMVRSAKVTTMTTIDQEAILSTPMLLPSLEEQSDIVAFLEAETARLDTLTTEAARAINLLKERRTALISAAVTGKIDVRHLAN